MGVAKVLARLLRCADSSELSGCSHIVDCVSMSSKCNYILNGWRDCSGAQTRLGFCCHAIKTAVDCVIYLCFKSSKDSCETILCRLVQSRQPAKRLRFFPEVERANTFLFWKTNVRKIQNAAVIPAAETVIFLDLCEA